MVDPMPLIGGDPALLAAYPNNTASLPGCASPINLCRDAAACPVHAKSMLCISNAFTAIRPSHHPPMTFADGSGGCPHCLGHLMADRQGGSLSNAVEMLQCSYQWWIFGAPSRFRSARAVTGRNGQNTYSVPLVLGSAVCLAALPGRLHQQPSSCLSETQNNPDLRCLALSPAPTYYVQPLDRDVFRPSDLFVYSALSQITKPGTAGQFDRGKPSHQWRSLRLSRPAEPCLGLSATPGSGSGSGSGPGGA